MDKRKQQDMVRCETPTPGKQPVRIPAWKYAVVRKGILKVVSRREPGIVFRELPAAVAKTLTARQRADLGSITWHTTVVKLHMEVVGEIRRIGGSSPQRLVRC